MIRPTHNYVVLKKLKDKYLKNNIALVVAAGPESLIKPDKKAVYKKKAGQAFEYKGKHYIVLEDQDILAQID